MLEDLTEKSAGALGGGSGKKYLRLSNFNDAAAFHENGSIGNGFCEAHLMSDDDHRDASARERSDDVEHLSNHFGIEGGGRFVEQNDPWFHRKGSGDGNPLLLSTRQLWRIFVGLVSDADTIKKAESFLTGLLRRRFTDPHRCQHNVTEHTHVRK